MLRIKNTELPSKVVNLLEELERTRDLQVRYKVHYELQHYLFHQGSLFDYSFLAFPHLVRIAEQWNYKARWCIISSAASIFNEEEIDSLESKEKLPIRVLYQRELDTLLKIIEEDLQQTDFSDYHFSSLLCDIFPFKGYPLLNKDFMYFVTSDSCGWFGWCNVCDAEMEIYIGEDSIIAELETSDWRKLRTDVEPIAPECLIGITKWLYETAKERGFDSVASKVACMVGKVKCLNCETEHQIPEYLSITDSFCKSSTEQFYKNHP